MAFCPRCGIRLRAIYEAEDPTKTNAYVCFSCGKKFDPYIEKIFKDGKINWKFVLQQVMHNSISKDFNSLYWKTVELFLKYDLSLDSRKKQYLNKTLKKFLENVYLNKENQ